MDWIRKIASTALLLSVLLIVNSCSIKVGLAPISSIDYSKVKTVSIADFQNRAEYVYAPLATEFNQGLKDLFIRQTRLSLVNGNADIEIDGGVDTKNLRMVIEAGANVLVSGSKIFGGDIAENVHQFKAIMAEYTK